MDETGVQNPIFKIANLNSQTNNQNQKTNFDMFNSLNQNIPSQNQNMMMNNNGMMMNMMNNPAMMMNNPTMMMNSPMNNQAMMMNNFMMMMKFQQGMNNQNNYFNNPQPSSIQNEEKVISLNFRINGEGKGNAGKLVIIQCNLNDKVSDIIKKFCTKAGVNEKEKKFVFNAKSLNGDLKASEAGLIHNANIFVISTKGVRGAQK